MDTSEQTRERAMALLYERLGAMNERQVVRMMVAIRGEAAIAREHGQRAEEALFTEMLTRSRAHLAVARSEGESEAP